jgi:cytosine/uracil/thiamine/allantoin permease
MMSYFIYWLVQFPIMLLSPQKLRHFFTVKSIIVPIAWFSILIWAMIKVPPSTSLKPRHSTLNGSQLSWAWLSAMNSALGNYATLSINIPDFTVSTSNLDPGAPYSSPLTAIRKKRTEVSQFSSISRTIPTHSSTANISR